MNILIEYKVMLFQGNTYEVCMHTYEDGNLIKSETKIQGSLSDCEAWIGLNVQDQLIWTTWNDEIRKAMGEKLDESINGCNYNDMTINEL